TPRRSRPAAARPTDRWLWITRCRVHDRARRSRCVARAYQALITLSFQRSKMMIRTAVIAIVLLGASATASQAQAARTPVDSLTSRFVGTWDGKFVTDHGPAGAMQVTVSRDTMWKMAVEMVHGDQAMPSRASDVKVAGKTISWTQEVMGMSCAASAKVD